MGVTRPTSKIEEVLANWISQATWGAARVARNRGSMEIDMSPPNATVAAQSSMPRYRRPRRKATARAVPVPQSGSSTGAIGVVQVSPGSSVRQRPVRGNADGSDLEGEPRSALGEPGQGLPVQRQPA